jgi:hypothetical protein
MKTLARKPRTNFLICFIAKGSGALSGQKKSLDQEQA